jgi:hypothetical protein
MASKAWFFNHWGELEEGGIPITTTPRSWILNGYGRCDFTIPLSDSFLKEKYIQFGNFIHIKHYPDETGGRSVYGILPDWTGMIVPTRTWNKDAVVVSAVSVEALLAFRAMPFVTVEGTSDTVFRQIIGYANASPTVTNSSIPINLGRVDTATSSTSLSWSNPELQAVSYSDELRTNAYDHIKKMVERVNMDWDIVGTLTPGSYALKLTANLYQRKGRDGLILTTVNTDEQNTLLTEQGTITNQVFAYNQAQTAETRIMQEVVDTTSMNKYGPFQANMVFTGITSSDTSVRSAGQMRVTTRGEPVKLVSRTALDYLDTFSFIATGNICFVYSPTVGFNPDGSLGFRSWARILSMDFNELTKQVALTVELINRNAEFPDPESFFT